MCLFLPILLFSQDKKFVKVHVPAYSNDEVESVLNYYRAAGWLSKGTFSIMIAGPCGLVHVFALI